MKMYQEPAREVPVINETEVLVCGGGPAGFAAALGAARAGAKTMLIEVTSCIGGQATSGLMSHWSGGTDGPVTDELWKRAEAALYPGEDIYTLNVINHVKTQKIMLDMLIEAGVEIQLYTFICDTIVENGKIKGVITESKSGREAIMSEIVIDCTGDGDVAYKAGAEFVKGREKDGRMQPVTLVFKIGGVDFDNAVFPGRFESNFEIPGGRIQDLGKKHIKFPAGHVLLYKSSIRGYVVVNMTNLIDIDGTDVRDLTRAEIVCREQIEDIMDFLRKMVPGYKSAYLIDVASQMGVRETRHFIGEYTITAEDIVEARIFDDWIATRNYFNFDIHSLDGPGLDKDGAQKEFKSKGQYTIPYTCCVPEKIDGLLLAGRNISGTHKAHSNYRVMPICANIGFGTGAAAAIAVQSKVQARNADIKKIQAWLLNNGVHI